MVLIIYPDQEECFRQAARLTGVPQLRTIHVTRTELGPVDVERIIGPVMDALVRPLTAKEKEKGRYELPDKRILFEGTLEEAQDFYSQTEIIANIGNAPFCKYTDGLPVVIPTEERVARMLKGTSHKADEILKFQSTHRQGDRQVQMGRSGIKGDDVAFLPMKRRATVEKIATIGVMAGCKPEHMPILLAMAESGGGCGDGRGGGFFVISGPIGKEVGMNFETNVLGPGNPSNRALGRAADLMWRNLGGEIPGVNNCGVYGQGINNCFPENAEALPPGWSGLNEEYDFKKNESCIVTFMGGQGGGWQGTQFSPGGYRAFQKSGHGGIARRLDVKGVPGPKNWLAYHIPSGFWQCGEGGITIAMLPEMALQLYQAGFKTKYDIYEWIYKQSFMTVGEYRTHSWPDMRTNAWNGVERTSGKHWKELSDDYKVPAVNDPFESCILVTGAGEEMALFTGGRSPLMDPAYGIDVWR
jgi:hypothetical protein